MVSDDPISQRQAEAGAVPGALGGKKRFKDLILNLLGNARPGITHHDLHLALVPETVCFNADLPVFAYGLGRVDEQIHENLLHLFRVHVKERNIRVQPLHHVYALFGKLA